jgi:hypothetical protein
VIAAELVNIIPTSEGMDWSSLKELHESTGGLQMIIAHPITMEVVQIEFKKIPIVLGGGVNKLRLNLIQTNADQVVLVTEIAAALDTDLAIGHASDTVTPFITAGFAMTARQTHQRALLLAAIANTPRF